MRIYQIINIAMVRQLLLVGGVLAIFFLFGGGASKIQTLVFQINPEKVF